jgi:chromosome segregation ATPase
VIDIVLSMESGPGGGGAPIMGEVGTLMKSLGLGDLPILTAENRNIHERLTAKQLEISRLQAEGEQEDDEVKRLFSHQCEVTSALVSLRSFLVARKEEARAENDLYRIAKLERERCKKDQNITEKAIQAVENKIEYISDNVETSKLVLEAMAVEYKTDLGMLKSWSDNIREYEEDILELLKCHNTDEIKIKELHLKLVSIRGRLDKSKLELDESNTENKMAQLALDKTAEEYRSLHKERQDVASKWDEATATVRTRDEELRRLFDRVNETRDKVRKKGIELHEQESFFENEKENNRELEKKIADLERKAQTLASTIDAREEEVREYEGELVLEEGETNKLKSVIDDKRVRLKDVKETKGRLMNRVKELDKELKEDAVRRVDLQNSAMSAEQTCNEMDRMLDKEEKQKDLLQWDLDKLREKKFTMEHDLKLLKDEVAIVKMKTKAFVLERARGATIVKDQNENLAKREEVAAANDFKIAELERQLSKMKGTISPENRAELKRELEGLKEDLAVRNADKRNVDHMLHKIDAEVRKVMRTIEHLESDKIILWAKLEEVSLETETSKCQKRQWREKVEALLLEEKLLMVNEKKVKQELKIADEALLELNKQAMKDSEEVLRRRAELESQREMTSAQHRHLQDDLRAVRSEVRERAEQTSKLRVKYGYLVKSLGGQSKEEAEQEGKVTSHAYHLVCLAQEKSELQEKIDEIREKLNVEEKDMEGLEKAVTLLTSSNGKYRANTFGSRSGKAAEETEELKELKAKIAGKQERLENLKHQRETSESKIKQTDLKLLRCAYELDSAGSAYEERSEWLKQAEKEVRDQEDKLSRANRICRSLRESLKAAIPDADTFEYDMDLRYEKEKQRSALIKLRELSEADEVFSAKYQATVDGLGLAAPTLSRFETQPAASRSRSISRNSVRYSATPVATLGGGGGSFYRRSTSAAPAYIKKKSQFAHSVPGTPQQSILHMEFSQTKLSAGEQPRRLPAVS